MTSPHFGFAIDLHRCIGCHTCSITCKIENNVPDGVWWNRALTDGGTEMDTFGGTSDVPEKTYVVVSCQHCENPACVKVCPVGATYKDPDTGAVRQDYDKCIGCRMCMSACPYTGVRSFNWDEPKYSLDFSVGDMDIPAHQKHVVEKCTMCWHRLAKGNAPACFEACPEYAIHFGDLNDPNSEVSQLIRDREYKQLLEDRGTKPSVYYLV